MSAGIPHSKSRKKHGYFHGKSLKKKIKLIGIFNEMIIFCFQVFLDFRTIESMHWKKYLTAKTAKSLFFIWETFCEVGKVIRK